MTVKTSLALLLPDRDFHFSLKDTQFPQSSSIPGNNMADTFLNLKGKKQQQQHRCISVAFLLNVLKTLESSSFIYPVRFNDDTGTKVQENVIAVCSLGL